MQRDRVVETRDQGQVVKGLDARFRGHDGAGISDFIGKLPGRHCRYESSEDSSSPGLRVGAIAELVAQSIEAENAASQSEIFLHGHKRPCEEMFSEAYVGWRGSVNEATPPRGEADP